MGNATNINTRTISLLIQSIYSALSFVLSAFTIDKTTKAVCVDSCCLSSTLLSFNMNVSHKTVKAFQSLPLTRHLRGLLSSD